MTRLSRLILNLKDPFIKKVWPDEGRSSGLFFNKKTYWDSIPRPWYNRLIMMHLNTPTERVSPRGYRFQLFKSLGKSLKAFSSINYPRGVQQFFE